MKARITLKAIESLTYTCTDPQQKKLNNQLQDVMNDFQGSLPESEGLVILPAVHERVKQPIRSSNLRSYLQFHYTRNMVGSD